MGYGKARPCKKCTLVKPVVARGLCSACFSEARKTGTLDDFPMGSSGNRIAVKAVDSTDIGKHIARECIEAVEAQAARFKPGSWDQLACLSGADAIREKFKIIV